MNGFERANGGAAWTDAEELIFPDDFSIEEAEFASELREFFSPEREELPPLYISTLMENERHTIAEPAFEQKLACRVFRRLCLPHDLISEHSSVFCLPTLRLRAVRGCRPLPVRLLAK